MSYNNYFCNRNYQRNTFHHIQNSIPPPPAPPPYFIPSIPPQTMHQADQQFIKQFESPSLPKHIKHNLISDVRSQLVTVVSVLKSIKEKTQMVTDNVNTMPESEWKLIMDDISNEKNEINRILLKINESQLDTLKKQISKRYAKRMRMKRLNTEKKKEKAEKMKELEERSRKIDENLQKIKDDISKAKMEEQSKIEADVVLKEVLRKKHDAKKCIVKLDALMKLRKARQNTARGRGENVSERDADTFNNNLEKLKSMWTQKLAVYDAEEAQLRTTLRAAREQDGDGARACAAERDVATYLGGWKEYLFGGELLPQVDFGGDVGRFVAVRSRWDQFVSSEGSPLPIGWVLPNK